MSNITFDIKCVRANPQAGICESEGNGGGSGNTAQDLVYGLIDKIVDPKSPIIGTDNMIVGSGLLVFNTLVLQGFTEGGPNSGVYIAPTTGGYEVNFHMLTTTYNSFAIGAQILVNSVGYPNPYSLIYSNVGPTIPVNAGNNNINATHLVNLKAGDKISILVFPSAVSTPDPFKQTFKPANICNLSLCIKRLF